MIITRIVFGFVALMLACSVGRTQVQTAQVAGDPIAQCDALAASPFDPDRLADPVAYGEVDGPAALAACSEALALDPGNPRLLMQFGRAQWHSGQPTRGLKSLEQAANAGSGAAAYEAFERYNVISGPFRNKMSADRVIRLGAKLGNPQSAYRLGLWLELGEPHGIVNLPGAAEWYRKAADLNIAEAQYRLGLMLRDGKGVDPNREEALHFLNLAAEAGHERASAEIAVMQQYNPNLTPDDSSYVEQLEYFAELGSSNAQYNLGVLYENGFGVPQDYHRAKQLYLQAYMDWHGKAGYAMGLLVLKEGKGSRPSLDTAAGWFESAASADPSIRSEATSAASAARARLRQNRRSEDENMHLTVLAGIVVFGLIMNLGGPSGDGAGGFEGVGRPPGICDDPVGRDLAREWCY